MEGGRGYLRIGELSRRTGVSPELLRAWEQRYGLLDPSRSAGGFRLYSDRDVARVLRTKQLIATGVSAAEAARRASTGGVSTAEEAVPLQTDLASRLSDALDTFDEEEGNAAIDHILASMSVEAALRDVLLPYLRRLGERWASGDASIGQEHFASNLIRGRLLGLARGWGAGIGPVLLLACPPGEEHELALLVFGIVAARRGWRVVYLGPDTPFDTMEATARDVEPAIVVLAVSSPDRLRGRGDEVRSLAALAPVAVGGVLSPGDAEALGVRLLDTDPVTAAGSLRA